MKKTYMVVMIIILISIFLIGCDGLNVPLDNIITTEYDTVNTRLAYIRISPSLDTMNINQSKTFEIKAYNSDNRLIKIESDKVDKWTLTYQCHSCTNIGNITPQTKSLQTTFTPYKTGRYTLTAKYDGIWSPSLVIQIK